MNNCDKGHTQIWYEVEKCPLCIVYENVSDLQEKLTKEAEGPEYD